MLTLDALTARRALIDQSPDLGALRDRLVVRAQPVLARMPVVPEVKALLSRDGGVCPVDGSALRFDPWSPDEHRCPTCGKSVAGKRHHAHWARAQHLWIAERAAHLATVHAVTGDPAAAARARELLAAYYERYFDLPNDDNVLGPSHLFFSTYLESIWILHFLAAAFLLRETGALDEHDTSRIDAIANEAATIIAEFNEGMSNRQTWNSAALTAIATWFDDEELAVTAVESRTGLLGHLADGFGSDGMWWEGENYHLFALRGLLIGLEWAKTAGAELLGDAAIAAHLGEALMAPAATALPDFTFPARKDARYGVSLAHPAYLESWEAGNAALGDAAPAGLAAWLRALYAVSPKDETTYDSYLCDAAEAPSASRSRTELSWWALLTMAPTLPMVGRWSAAGRLMEQQGLAVMRNDRAYVSLECTGGGGGHGHPDRLHLTMYADGVHWLPDPGAGSYVTRDLLWYRSTLAHNAPLLDDADQSPGDLARCEAYDTGDRWTWCAGTWNGARRSVVVGPDWTADLIHLETTDVRQLDVPWHPAGHAVVATSGTWVADTIRSEFVTDVERFVPDGVSRDQDQELSVQVTATVGDAALQVRFAGDGELLRATAPGVPGAPPAVMYLRRMRRHTGSMLTILDPTGSVTAVEVNGNEIVVHEGERRTTVEIGGTSATIVHEGVRVVLGGVQSQPMRPATFVTDRPPVTLGHAPPVRERPALDGSLRGFDRSAPLTLDEEYQYFRSEAPYPGSESFSATAYINWSDDELYVGVDVVKDDLQVRAPDEGSLQLDNEVEDINADGIQLYYRDADQRVSGWLIRPSSNGALATRSIGPKAVPGEVAGAWQRTETGYRITARIPCPVASMLGRNDRLGFDLIVNEMRASRVRRSGQLVWSGGPGWVYLRGDRHDPSQFGELELNG